MRAVINYGHGPKNVGYDPGAIGPTGYKETIQNAEVGTLVADKLKANGWDILSIHDGDLWDVTNQANKFKPDVFLSIHANSVADRSAHGIETIALAPGGVGEKVAREIQKELVIATGLADRGIKFRNLHVLGETRGYPSVLVEIGFISNPQEEALMRQDTWDEKVASATCRGFSRALGVAYVEPVGAIAPETPAKSLASRIAIDDTYLSVRVREGEVDQAIKDINKLGFAAKVMDLA